MWRLTLVTDGSPGWRAGKSPALLDFRGLLRSGRWRTAKPGRRIFSRNVARARSCWSGGESRGGVGRGLQDVREADPRGRDARGVRADPGEPAQCLADGEQRPHFLGDPGRVLAAEDGLSFSHVGLVAADDGLAVPAVRVAAGQVECRVTAGGRG